MIDPDPHLFLPSLDTLCFPPRTWAKPVTLAFSQLGKPTDNAYIESFNGSLREECWTVHWFEDLTDARAKMQVWKQEYNEDQPHRSLKNLTPLQYKAQWDTQRSENR